MKRVIILALSVAAMVGCAKESGDESSTLVAATFKSNITSTRVVGNKWESGDAIGITMLPENTLYNYLQRYNVNYVADIDQNPTVCNIVVADESQTIYYPVDKTRVVDFYAYCPYNSALMVDNMIFPLDVSSQTTPQDIDLITASAKSNYENGEHSNINLTFTHRMAKITLDFTESPTLDFDQVEKIRLVGLPTEAKFDLMEDKFIEAKNIDDIAPRKESEFKYSAIVIPATDGEETIYDLTELLLVVDTPIGEFKVDLTDGGLEAGDNHTYNVTVQRTGITATLSDINDWVDNEDDDRYEAE